MKTLSRILPILLALIILASSRPDLIAAQDQALYDLLAGINSTRIGNGLPPFALNSLLTEAARSHSEYMGRTGSISHDGANGSRPIDRVQAVGYPATRANENIYAGWNATSQDALNWWLGSKPHTDNILHPILREIGIGIAYGSDEMVYYTLNFSAQVGVIPIFIDNDAYTTNQADVTLTLWNEGLFSRGASEIIVSNSPDFANGQQMPWTQYIPWTLNTASGSGPKTVYVRFLNVGGVNVDSQDAIQYDPSAAGSPPPTPIPTQPPVVTIIPPTYPPAPPAQPTHQSPTFPPTITPTLEEFALIPSTISARLTTTPTLLVDNDQVADVGSALVGAAGAVDDSADRPATSTNTMPIGLLRLILTSTLFMGIVAMVIGGAALTRGRQSHTNSAQVITDEEKEGPDHGSD